MALRCTVLIPVFLGVLLAAGGASAANGANCDTISFVVDLHAEKEYVRKIGGGLALRFEPTNFGDATTRLNGWRMLLLPMKIPRNGPGYIYLVNPPLRFSPWQDIGTSYGIYAQEKLKRPIELAFVLNQAYYELIHKRLDDALWMADAKDPDHAGERYENAGSALSFGVIRIEPMRYTLTEKGRSIERLKLQVSITVPESFSLVGAPTTHSVCLARPTWPYAGTR